MASNTFLSRRNAAITAVSLGLAVMAAGLTDPAAARIKSVTLLTIGIAIALGSAWYSFTHQVAELKPGVVTLDLVSSPNIHIGRQPRRFEQASLEKLAEHVGKRSVEVKMAPDVADAHQLGQQLMQALGAKGITVTVYYNQAAVTPVSGASVEGDSDPVVIEIGAP